MRSDRNYFKQNKRTIKRNSNYITKQYNYHFISIKINTP
jgi:hypothetical protein